MGGVSLAPLKSHRRSSCVERKETPMAAKKKAPASKVTKSTAKTKPGAKKPTSKFKAGKDL